MNWIAPTFSDEGSPGQPPSKKSRSSKPINESKFLPTSSVNENTQISSCDWLNQYKPSSVAELAVQVKKINEFEAWIHQATNINAKSKFLLLTGPSGCGKTTMVQTVCESLGFKILEWITPLDRPNDDHIEFPSRFEVFSKNTAKLFEDYLFRSSRYNSCLSSNTTKKLILVKDFPNVFMYNPSSFHDILENVSSKCITPIVFICSDECICKKLFPATLNANGLLQRLSLNPITDPKIIKILKKILSLESKKNASMPIMPDQNLYEVCSACQGDLRSAITKLFFLSRNCQSQESISQTTKKTYLKRASQETKTLTDKDKRIDFFHGVGRVLYPKKIVSDEGVKFVHSTEAIVETFLTEPKGFLGQLHENYPGKLSNVSDLSEAAERLSKSDLLTSRWQDRDIFAHYSLGVAVQGLMVANRVPQKAKFEAFRRSQTSRMEVDGKAIELEGKALFSELQVLDYTSLVDILPYAKLLLPNLNVGQLEYIRKTSVFKSI